MPAPAKSEPAATIEPSLVSATDGFHPFLVTKSVITLPSSLNASDVRMENL
jgi:hypothetical protein